MILIWGHQVTLCKESLVLIYASSSINIVLDTIAPIFATYHMFASINIVQSIHAILEAKSSAHERRQMVRHVAPAILHDKQSM